MLRRGSLRLGLFLLLLGGPLSAEDKALAAGEGKLPAFSQAVDVVLSAVKLRAWSNEGAFLLGLEPDDLRLTIDGDEVSIVDLEWTGFGKAFVPQRDLLPATQSTHDAARVFSTERRNVVVFVQTSFASNRLLGALRLLPLLSRQCRQLSPNDRVGVVSFDTHLKLRLDLTNDCQAFDDSMGHAVRKGPGIPFAPSTGDSGGPTLTTVSQQLARQTATPEEALTVVAEALAALEGERFLLLVGHGFGNVDPRTGDVRMPKAYDTTRASLLTGGVTVFALDTTLASSHSLALGLQRVASDTGGLFYPTYEFPRLAVRKVTEAMAGYYTLFFVAPDSHPGRSLSRRRPPKVEVHLRQIEGQTMVSAARHNQRSSAGAPRSSQ